MSLLSSPDCREKQTSTYAYNQLDASVRMCTCARSYWCVHMCVRPTAPTNEVVSQPHDLQYGNVRFGRQDLKALGGGGSPHDSSEHCGLCVGSSVSDWMCEYVPNNTHSHTYTRPADKQHRQHTFTTLTGMITPQPAHKNIRWSYSRRNRLSTMKHHHPYRRSSPSEASLRACPPPKTAAAHGRAYQWGEGQR